MIYSLQGFLLVTLDVIVFPSLQKIARKHVDQLTTHLACWKQTTHGVFKLHGIDGQFLNQLKHDKTYWKCSSNPVVWHVKIYIYICIYIIYIHNYIYIYTYIYIYVPFFCQETCVKKTHKNQCVNCLAPVTHPVVYPKHPLLSHSWVRWVTHVTIHIKRRKDVFWLQKIQT